MNVKDFNNVCLFFSFLQVDPELEKKLKGNKITLESEYEVWYVNILCL